MSYRVEELAAAAEVGVDTVRYYQREGLLAQPRRDGRVARYDDSHLARLREIRGLAERGFTLAQIRDLGRGRADELLEALALDNAPDPTLDRTELAARAGVPEFIIDVVISAGLLVPTNHPDGERFTPDAVDMLIAARTLVSEGVSFEELTALALRHAVNVEDVVDSAIELFKRAGDQRGGDRRDLAAMLHRLVPVASNLVAQHFERTLLTRALDRLGDDTPAATATVIVVARCLDTRVDPLEVYAGSTHHHRFVWLRPEIGLGIAGIGAVERIEPTGADRFSGASAARAALAARVKRHGPHDAPAPVLVGGFAFAAGDDRRPPAWTGFGDARFVLPELTVIDRPDGTWLLAAGRVGADDHTEAALAELGSRIDGFVAGAPEASRPAPRAAELEVGDPGHDPDYEQLVAAGIDAIDSGRLEKVVLARAHRARGSVQVARLLAGLRDRYPTCAVFAVSVGESTFLAASPEPLAVLDGHELSTVALAGTAPRGSDPAADERLADELLRSGKNRAEHAFVVEAIRRDLAGLGLVDPTPARPDVLRLARVQHLRTPISATVEQGVHMDVFRVAGVLHPTPAVGGTPTADATAFIAGHERFDRGWYAAPVGWCDLDGNGELRVALRSALHEGARLHLFAGAGIVAHSVPSEELAETAMKLQALVDVVAP